MQVSPEELRKKLLAYYELRNKRKNNGGLLCQWRTEHHLQSPSPDEVAPSWDEDPTLKTSKAVLNLEKKKREELEKKKEKEERQRILETLRKMSGKSMKSKVSMKDMELVDVYRMNEQEGNDVHIQVRFLDGSVERTIFGSLMKIGKICDYVLSRRKGNVEYESGITLAIAYPKKEFSSKELEEMTLEDAGLTPRASVNVVKNSHGWMRKELDLTKFYHLVSIPKHQLRGDSAIERRKFQQQMKEKEIEEKKEDLKANKQDIKRIRKLIEEDKVSRKKKYQKNFHPEPIPSGSPTVSEPLKAPKSDKKVILQIKLPDGSNHGLAMENFQTLQDVHDELVKAAKIDGSLNYSFVIPFPRKEFNAHQFKDTTMTSANLVPRAVLIINATPKELP